MAALFIFDELQRRILENNVYLEIDEIPSTT